jgi:hypothetical protein
MFFLIYIICLCLFKQYCLGELQRRISRDASILNYEDIVESYSQEVIQVSNIYMHIYILIYILCCFFIYIYIGAMLLQPAKRRCQEHRHGGRGAGWNSGVLSAMQLAGGHLGQFHYRELAPGPTRESPPRSQGGRDACVCSLWRRARRRRRI